MKALEVILNGRKLCIATLPEHGSLCVAASLSNPLQDPAGTEAASPATECLLNVGGMEAKDGHHWFLEYLQQSLTAGDEITIRLVETSNCSDPTSRRVETGEQRLRSKRNYLLQLKRELGES
jgi:hypothetical protein